MSGNEDNSWLRTPVMNVAEVAQRYDDWATTYDQTLKSWNYDAPVVAARLLASRFAARHPSDVGSVTTRSVLDIGCGTGLTGLALTQEGVQTVDGLDLSLESLAIAHSRNVYGSLQQHDFNAGPLPFANDTYDAANCVGVMSYAHEPGALIREMCRVVKSKGTIVFSHRSDLWDEADFPSLLNELRVEGILVDVTWTEPKPYMPGNQDFADRVLVRYVVATAS